MKSSFPPKQCESPRVSSILEASSRLIAEQGRQVSLALIAKAAGLSESMVRVLFPTKAALFDSLYLDLHRQKLSIIMSLHDAGQPFAARAYAIWEGHIIFAQQHPERNKALNLLNYAETPSVAVRAIEAINFPDHEVAQEFAAHPIFDDRDPGYVDAILTALVDITVEFIKRHPEEEDAYKQSGFAAVQRLFLQ